MKKVSTGNSVTQDRTVRLLLKRSYWVLCKQKCKCLTNLINKLVNRCDWATNWEFSNLQTVPLRSVFTDLATANSKQPTVNDR